MKTPIVILIRIAFTVISGCNDKNITESNESYDLVLLNGRVIDPEIELDTF